MIERLLFERRAGRPAVRLSQFVLCVFVVRATAVVWPACTRLALVWRFMMLGADFFWNPFVWCGVV